MTNVQNDLGRKEILDIQGAADYLGVSRSHVSHILAGKVLGVPPIPHVRAGRRTLIRRDSLQHWFEQQEIGSRNSVPQ